MKIEPPPRKGLRWGFVTVIALLLLVVAAIYWQTERLREQQAVALAETQWRLQMETALRKTALAKAKAASQARDEALRQAQAQADALRKAEEQQREEAARKHDFTAHALGAGERWTNGLGMVFARVPGTSVLFGIWETRVRDFDAFATAAAYDGGNKLYCVGSNGQWGVHEGFNWKNPGIKYEQSPLHPVVGASWQDAQAFCAWLTQREQKEGRLATNQSYRLPTDLEWSRAAGLENETGPTPKDKDGQIKNVYPWGTQWPPPPKTGNFFDETARKKHTAPLFIQGYDDGYAEAAPVGSFAPDRHGLYDLAGNVWEWCEDVFDTPNGPKVLRGGSWQDADPVLLFASNRASLSADRRCSFVGFRVVLAGVP